MDTDLNRLAAIEDPADRAKRASELVAWQQNAITEVSRIRREALNELLSQGLTHTEIAKKIGTTRARVGQLLTSGPRPERVFLGSGPLTVALGGKVEANRRDQKVQAVASTEAFAAYEVLSELARSLSLQTTCEVVPPPGLVELNRTNLVVLTSPRLLPFVGQVLAADTRYGFDHDKAGWFLIDRENGTEYRSPSDSGEERDYAYVGRLPRPDGRGTFLYLAGIHSIGTLGAARFVENNIEDLYRELKTRRFSLLIECAYEHDTNKVVSVSPLTPISRHEGV